MGKTVPEAAATDADRRVVLRPMGEDDAGPLHRVLSDPRVYGPTSYDVLDLDATRSVVAGWLASERQGRARRWAVATTDDDRLIGTCGFHRIDPRHQVAELGYEIAPAFWGRGYATAAVGVAVTRAFAAGIRRIEAVVWVENPASIRVLEKRSFRREGRLRGYRLCRGEPRDFFAYARLFSDGPEGQDGVISPRGDGRE